jgi:hypothetical protein
LSTILNMCSFMILNFLCLLSAKLVYTIVHVYNMKSLIQFMNWHVPWKCANGVGNRVLQVLQFC